MSMDACACVAYGMLMRDVTHNEPVFVYQEMLLKKCGREKPES